MLDKQNQTQNTAQNNAQDEKLSLERAFRVFIEQSARLEKSHTELQQKLKEAQLDLASKNKELASKMIEIETIKRKLSAILESITDSIFLVSSDGRSEIKNRAGADLLKLLGIPGGSIASIPELTDYVKTTVPLKDADISINIDGELQYFMLSNIPLADEEDIVNYRIIILKNVTEKRLLQKKAGRESRMAALGRVAASVAHEIRNPLGAIEGFAMLLQRDLKDNPSALRLASKTVYATRQVNSVVSNLLNYTREMKNDRHLCDLNQLISETIDFIKPMADDRKVKISCELSPETLIVLIDPVQIRQVVSNITINSVEACTGIPGAELKISSCVSGKFVIMEFLDNGPGIPEKTKKHIFEPFFTMKEGGIGLGLALCQKIIESHEAEISESGKEGSGARFLVKFKKAENGK